MNNRPRYALACTYIFFYFNFETTLLVDFFKLPQSIKRKINKNTHAFI